MKRLQPLNTARCLDFPVHGKSMSSPTHLEGPSMQHQTHSSRHTWRQALAQAQTACFTGSSLIPCHWLINIYRGTDRSRSSRTDYPAKHPQQSFLPSFLHKASAVQSDDSPDIQMNTQSTRPTGVMESTGHWKSSLKNTIHQITNIRNNWTPP